MNDEKTKEYYKLIEKLYDFIYYNLSGLEKDILLNKIEELEYLSKYLLRGEDNENNSI